MRASRHRALPDGDSTPPRAALRRRQARVSGRDPRASRRRHWPPTGRLSRCSRDPSGGRAGAARARAGADRHGDLLLSQCGAVQRAHGGRIAGARPRRAGQPPASHPLGRVRVRRRSLFTRDPLPGATRAGTPPGVDPRHRRQSRHAGAGGAGPILTLGAARDVGRDPVPVFPRGRPRAGAGRRRSRVGDLRGAKPRRRGSNVLAPWIVRRRLLSQRADVFRAGDGSEGDGSALAQPRARWIPVPRVRRDHARPLAGLPPSSYARRFLLSATRQRVREWHRAPRRRHRVGPAVPSRRGERS